LTQGVVGPAPKLELKLHNFDEVLEFREVLIVKALSACKLPHAFDRVEFGTVGRQKIELEIGRMHFPPGSVKACMVVFGVVDNHNDTPIGSAGTVFQMLEEIPIGFSIELSTFALTNQFAIPETDGTKITNALASRMMANYWVADFGRYPHPTAGTKLLKVDLVACPEIDLRIAAQRYQFFL